MIRPTTRYAKSGDIHIAYQIAGSGPLDLVLIPGFVSHLDLGWDDPGTLHFRERLSSFARLIRFDKRGTGMSDRVPIATLEERMDDARAVMDAVGSEQAAILGISEGGPMSLLFAATYPARVTALVLYGAFAKRLWSPDYPIGVPSLDREAYLELIERQWSDEADLSVVAPSLMHDPAARQRFAETRRMSASPGAALSIARMNSEIDVRHALSAIHVPTLILHRAPDRDVAVENGRYLAANIPGARYVEFPTGDHLLTTGDVDGVLDEIEEFLTGVRHGPEPDRVLATVLFTDIADSTARAAAMGDHRWTELKSAHHAIVRRELTRFRGCEIDTAGDGFFATFDGPARAIRCALAIGRGVEPLGLRIRAGLHTGEVEIRQKEATGLAVHIGARVMSSAAAGEVLVSSTVRDLVAGAGIVFEDRGAHQLKGVPGEWRLFVVSQ
jgi:pimeloyl-ACP methyl ester carboxylesterase